MKKLAAIFLVIAMLLTLTGCRAFSYWDGMTYNQTRRYICKELKEKYGEEFTVVKTSKTGTGELWAACSPKSNESFVFRVQVDAYGKHSRELLDDYIEYIVGRELKCILDDTLSKYCNNYAIEVHLSGLHRYDFGIHSANEATINNYIVAQPDEISTVWIAFDKDEIGDDYGKVEEYLTEIFNNYTLPKCAIKCYFVSSDIIAQCEERIKSNHIEYGSVVGSMEVLLSSHRPWYDYAYNVNEKGLFFRGVAD